MYRLAYSQSHGPATKSSQLHDAAGTIVLCRQVNPKTKGSTIQPYLYHQFRVSYLTTTQTLGLHIINEEHNKESEMNFLVRTENLRQTTMA